MKIEPLLAATLKSLKESLNPEALVRFRELFRDVEPPGHGDLRPLLVELEAHSHRI